MGWAHCGTDSGGREIGYSIEAECDYPGCREKIDRGLSHVCGLMHGEDEYSCERYFCAEHKRHIVESPERRVLGVCDLCYGFMTLDSESRIEGHKDFGVEGMT